MTTQHEPTPAAMVRAFHEKYDHPIGAPGEPVSKGLAAFRVNLAHEEMRELDEATFGEDIVGIADGLADLVYVLYGTALTYGIDLDAVLAEVHRSNMTKDPDPTGGKPRKGVTFQPPNIQAVLEGRAA